MISEANRLLKDGGACLIVSLAQEHSLKLLLSSIDIDSFGTEQSAWAKPLEIFEVKPTSDASTLRPYIFVIRKRKNKASVENAFIKFYTEIGSETLLNKDEATLDNLNDWFLESTLYAG